MQIITEVTDLRRIVAEARKNGKSIGFIPTMGFLHAGHLALMNQARQENELVVTSIFVNPTQFGPNEDFDAYPRNPEKDKALMAGVGVDVAFCPSVETLYPEGYETFIEVGSSLTSGLCGASRPGHFRGVATVVVKLFNLVQPDKAYFGQKDAQQVAVIRRVVKDLNLPVDIISCPIVRESDGLAMSSRNTYLTMTERQEALVLNHSLKNAEDAVKNGVRNATVLGRLIRGTIATAPSATVDYVEIVNAQTMSPVEILEGSVLIALAVRIGKTRLIDNLVLEVPHAG